MTNVVLSKLFRELFEVAPTTLMEDHYCRAAAAAEEGNNMLAVMLTILEDGPVDQSRERAGPKSDEDTWDSTADEEWGDIAKEME
ncbi:hypothetical protein BGZ73_004867 [Actinomortierella ambigua]|nr:hypothetical protein BGZ73_004867 [Actinomortierella ambigua]